MKKFIISIIIYLFYCHQLINGAQFKVTSQIYMDFSHDEKYIGQITIGLFGELAPKTVENFREICLNGINGKSYAGSPIHRIIDKFVIQGGDIVSGDGQGSTSIYGTYFDDEYLDINHTMPGFVAMANRGPNTNGCQFYINTMATPWLDGKHTVFGKVLKGQAFVHTVEKVKTDTDDYPVKPVYITNCGDEPMTQPFLVSDSLYDLWGWIHSSIIPVGTSLIVMSIFHIIIRKLDRIIEERDAADKNK